MNKDKQITHEMMLAENGNNYNPADIRTYACKPLAHNPSREVAIHLSLYNSHKSGNRHSAGSWSETPYGGHFCESSVEFHEKVLAMSLNFPKAANFNQVKLLKSVKLPSLFPSWMMERYEKHDDVVLHHKTPIYYDSKVDKFILFLDTEFFRQTTPTGLNFKNTEHTEAYKGKDGKYYAAFKADSMKALIDCMSLSDDKSPLKQYVQLYRQRFLDATKAKRVICLAMKIDCHQNPDNDPNNGLPGSSIRLNSDSASRANRETIERLIIAQKTEFELYQGALIDDLIYLMDEEGTINPNAIMCSVKHQRQKKQIIKMHDHNDFTYLMMPYTEADWNSLKTIHDRMFNLMKDLSNFFSAGYNENELLDMPVTEISADTPKLLK
jgi:hypothetical protein